MRPQIAQAFHRRADGYSRSGWHAEIAADFVTWAGLGEGDRVLDVGAGTGFSTFAAARSVGPEGGVLGLDLSEAMVRKARTSASPEEKKNTAFVIADAHEIGLRDHSEVDAVIFSMSLHYLQPVSALRRFGRILRPGGMLAYAALQPLEPRPFRLFKELAYGYGISIPDRSHDIGRAEWAVSTLESQGFGDVRTHVSVIAIPDRDLVNAWDVHVTMFQPLLRTLDPTQLSDFNREYETELLAARQAAGKAGESGLGAGVLYVSGRRRR
ncbi:methyltransferase domain-containing protein [Streptosporangium sp. NPDC051022]|uniref:class I SAM-dependent methyltransferase n=1 Tax=Streptosporangium sp. NPDC051022 TaxID=3155752 RepID=UPI003438C6A0